jgi:hypothetical protein
MNTYKVTYMEKSIHGTYDGFAIVEAESKVDAYDAVKDSARMEGVRRLVNGITRMENA